MPVEPIKTPPSPQEMAGRLEKTQNLMARENLDLYVAAHPDNVYYLTNFAYIPFERPFFLVIPQKGRPVMILPLLERDHAQQRVIPDVEYRTYAEFPAPKSQGFESALADVVSSSQTVGLESSLALGIEKTIPGRKRVVDLVDEARRVKTDYEIGRIAYASAVVDAGLAKCLSLCQPGAQELTLYSESIRQMMGYVILEVPNPNLLMTKFIAAVWPKRLSAQPHAVPGLFDVLEAGGPQVSIVAGQADGYSAEVERTFFVGRVPDEARKPWEAMMAARALAYERIRPGVRAADVDDAVLGFLERKGYGPAILHRTGHGFGITGHEPPWIARGSQDVLEPGMVISVEPGLYLPELGGFRHSDTVLITETGYEILTKTSDRLEDLVLKA